MPPTTAVITLLLLALPATAQAFIPDQPAELLDLTDTSYGYLALLVFAIGYLFVVGEDRFGLQKSKPVIVAAGIIWLLVGFAYAAQGDTTTAGIQLQKAILDYAELFLFLLSAMTFINMMEERHVFVALRSWLISRDYSLRTVYWLTGTLTFLLSPIADNMSSALLMGAVVMAVGGHTPRFVALGCINIVVAANAGGVFSPFGDITSLMVWQQGRVQFVEFLLLIVPSLVNWLVPAAIISVKLPDGPPQARHNRQRMKKGATWIMGLFVATVAFSVFVHAQLHLPPVLGMMTGLGLVKLYAYLLSRHDPVLFEHGHIRHHHRDNLGGSHHEIRGDHTSVVQRFDMFRVVERSAWDTLMFFYGIVLCVGGLATLGYLDGLSEFLYGELGALGANTLIGVISAMFDNIPIMFAVLEMNPQMSLSGWLLVTLTVGTGGSLLAIGSAAGVALMGQAAGTYTFVTHLKWSWAILLGYLLSIGCHLLINGT
ncbi:MAG: sodium:proton antiporter [Oceanospirillaceae bacterium]|nr:sodium:proton antiporter [Oceanospirillaceae bacterium]